MMRAPSHAEISLAERGLAQSKHEVCASAVRLRKVLLATLAKPVTLAGIGGAAGVAGFLLTRRFKHLKMNVQQTATQEAPLTATTAATAASTSILGIIFAFVMRYSMQRLPQIALWLMKGSSQTDPAPVVVDTTHLPPPRYRANGTHT
jgi:hypothetical protein